jgi:succinate dehydrogenase hydrophobic anchor subunit
LFFHGWIGAKIVAMDRRNFAMLRITALVALLIAAFSLTGCKNSNDEEYQRPRSTETPAIYKDLPPQGSIGNS